jgi:hypothetical protein
MAATILFAQSPVSQPSKAAPSTYCNPLPLPDYPIGKRARDIVPGTAVGPNDFLWLLGRQEQFRELADVTVLWEGGKWYMYPSVDMAWVSSDGGVTWEHHPLNVRDIGYAPTVVKHNGKYLLMAIDSPLYTSDSPLGPFTAIGKIALPGNVARQIDPMLLSDDDGRLYYYWGNVFGIELDANNPTRSIGQPIRLMQFEPDKYPWQRCGDWNEDANNGYIEGAWVIKQKGTYYLTYSAAGTEFSTYAVGCLTSKSPLGPFTHQKNNPIMRNTTGLVTGTGHGSFVEGPNGSLWSFYTLRAGVVHGWERRLGMDPAWIGDDGELLVSPASSTPMRLTGTAKGAEPSGWVPLNQNRQSSASTTAANLTTRLAFDDDLRTWWQPDAGDKAPTLTSSLVANATADAVRIVWRDIGVNTRQGAVPGPFRYKVEMQTGANHWTTVIDRTASDEDLLIDYREITPIKATAARLTIVGAPTGITPGVAEFTVFGQSAKK